jgi:hypothetical protein
VYTRKFFVEIFDVVGFFMPNGKLFLAALAMLAFSSHGYAATLFLSSQSGGSYDYELQVPALDSVVFADDNTIVLSGLSGVTGASLPAGVPLNVPNCFTATFTSTSATFTANGTAGCRFPPGEPGGPPSNYGTFQVTSSVTTPGTIDYASDLSSGTLAGTTQGPVSAAPEPATWATALLPLLWIARRKAASAPPTP